MIIRLSAKGDTMKRIVAVLAFFTLVTQAFSQDVALPTSEVDAIAMITRTAESLRFSAADSATAAEAFKAMRIAGIRIEYAYRLVSDALEAGLGSADMVRLTERIRLRTQLKESAVAREDAIQAMVREHIATRAMVSLEATQTQAQVQSRIQTTSALENDVETQQEPGTQPKKGK
jgi:hypothetical protein